jgi:hypothetical protein
MLVGSWHYFRNETGKPTRLLITVVPEGLKKKNLPFRQLKGPIGIARMSFSTGPWSAVNPAQTVVQVWDIVAKCLDDQL